MVQFPSTPRPTPTPGPTGRAVPTDTRIRCRQYVWDGWLCIAEIVEREELGRSHTWGIDLSGSQSGAGGVGGLVFLVNANDVPVDVFQCFYDGNGNLVSLRDDSQAITAQYDYGPFGELLTARGDYAAENPYRFSTKYVDAETGLYYYGYRYYNSSTGRWLSRDPIGEEGGLNLYGFVSNAATVRVDPLGRECYKPKLVEGPKSSMVKFTSASYDRRTVDAPEAQYTVWQSYFLYGDASATASDGSLSFTSKAGMMVRTLIDYLWGGDSISHTYDSYSISLRWKIECSDKGNVLVRPQWNRNDEWRWSTAKGKVRPQIIVAEEIHFQERTLQIDTRAKGDISYFTLKITGGVGVSLEGMKPAITISPARGSLKLYTPFERFGPYRWQCDPCKKD